MYSAARPLLPNAGRIAIPQPTRALSTTRSLLAKPRKPAPPQKPLILEKPTKFNPPSHGSRLPRGGGVRRIAPMPQHYGGELPKEELAAQRKRDYPTLMAPEGTWAHWFWTNRVIHAFITTGTLIVLGIVTYFLNFTHTSPFKHMIPPISDALRHPIDFVSTWLMVMSLHRQEMSRLALEERSRRADDAIKRQAFQRVHNVDKGPIERLVGGRDPPVESKAEGEAGGSGEAEAPPKKKWFGVF